MYTLYYLPGACSLAVHVALLEVNASFDLVSIKVPDGEKRPADFLKINPRGSVPVLVKDGFALREGAAILTTVLDEHESPLLPRTGNTRAEALEWLAFANASLHPAYGRLFMMHKLYGDKATENPFYEVGIKSIQKLWDDIEARLNESEYLAGEEITIADILTTVIANWTPTMRGPITMGEKTKALLRRVSGRPTYQKAMAAEHISYSAAA